jgi:hypothetical protein
MTIAAHPPRCPASDHPGMVTGRQRHRIAVAKIIGPYHAGLFAHIFAAKFRVYSP